MDIGGDRNDEVPNRTADLDIQGNENPTKGPGSSEEPGNKGDNCLSQVVENGKNKLPIYCTRCPSKILNAQVGTYVKQELELPRMSQRKGADGVEFDVVNDCFQLKDMFQFENVGFCNSVNQIKFLSCAECEIGPVGWQDLTNSAIFIAIPRVLTSDLIGEGFRKIIFQRLLLVSLLRSDRT